MRRLLSGTRSGAVAGLCTACGLPLLARYDLDAARRRLVRDEVALRPGGVWRWRELLPAVESPVSLGEGGTPLLPVPRLGARLDLAEVWVKDESVNPTGSFKARGLAVAVSMARALGATRLAIPTAGNAGLALAAYAAAAGLAAEVFCPADTPLPMRAGMSQLGARVHLVDGLIHDCAARVRAGAAHGRWFDVSTLREPYRIEGKKTMGYEIAAQLDWSLPDVIIYPTGGGTGLIGLWKAFAELETLGWITARRPRLVSVQAAGCAPIVRAFAAGEDRARPWEGARTAAAGLRVPAAIGDFMILGALRASQGLALAVDDDELIAAARQGAALTGILFAPEGGAVLAAAARLRASGWLERDSRVVLFNTGTALSYADVLGVSPTD